MKLLKIILLLAPFITKGASSKNRLKIALSSATIFTVVLSAILMNVAGFIRLSNMYGADIACLILGILYLVLALIFATKLKFMKRQIETHKSEVSDPLENYIPETILNDPAIAKLMKTVNEHPIPAASAAALVGILIGRQHFADASGK